MSRNKLKTLKRVCVTAAAIAVVGSPFAAKADFPNTPVNSLPSRTTRCDCDQVGISVPGKIVAAALNPITIYADIWITSRIPGMMHVSIDTSGAIFTISPAPQFSYPKDQVQAPVVYPIIISGRGTVVNHNGALTIKACTPMGICGTQTVSLDIGPPDGSVR
jgi:hypothetical protein